MAGRVDQNHHWRAIFPSRFAASSRSKIARRSGPPLTLRPFGSVAPDPVHLVGASAREWFRPTIRRPAMPAIGYVTKDENGTFKGQLRTLSIRAEIAIVPNTNKARTVQPDYRVLSSDVEIGAGWNRRAETSGRDYVSLSLAAPEFGPRRLYANLGRVPGDDERFAIIWNPAD
ncbi:DUF736 domain-containing protein [Sphingomonas sp.]|uniref:DUF736 domain-containing protein n=1 Tax=Sphingomonas sp. TaxID=28214 RepID=UPI003B00DA0C